MLENLIYTGWATLNTAVVDQSPDRDDDEIVVKQNTCLNELDRCVLSEIPGPEFPGLNYGWQRVTGFCGLQLDSGSAG